jgi:hypothetical protein
MIVNLHKLNYKLYSKDNNLFNSFLVKLNKKNFHTNSDDRKYYEWLAGLIDGDGHFYSNQNWKGVNLAITIDNRDKEVLNEIKDRFGGGIYSIKDTNASRYMLSNEKGLILLIKATPSG